MLSPVGIEPTTLAIVPLSVGLTPAYLPAPFDRNVPPTLAEMLGWLDLYCDADQVTELRILDAKDLHRPEARPFTVSGYFDSNHRAQLVEAAWYWTQRAKGVYITLNPIDPELLALRSNRVEMYAKDTATDAHILRRRLLMVDIDPRRVSTTTGKSKIPGVSATEAEKARAREMAEAIYQHLRDRHWPDPVAVDSGNGYQLLYRIDEPADDGGLIRRCLQALAAQFDDEGAQVDQKVFNPARIAKLPGTLARKGENTDTHPHRWSRVINAPMELQAVSGELLAALAAEAPGANPTAPTKPATSPAEPGAHRIANRARAYLAKLPPAIQGQDGSGRTFAAACALVIGFGLSEEDALPLLTEYSQRCEPPWSEKELAHKLDGARKKAEEEPERVGYLRRKGPELDPADLRPLSPFAGYAGDLPRPAPIRADLRPVPALPPEFLPEPFRNWVADIARRVGCPLEYVAIAALIAVAALVGRQVTIRPKCRDDWTVVANLWGGIVGRPGVLKTPALAEALKPLKRLVQEAMDEHQTELAAYQSQADLRKLQYDATRKRYLSISSARTPDAALIAELEAVLQTPPADAPPVGRRYLVNDATVEKLQEILSQNPNGVLVFRDELVGFFRSLEKQGRETDRTFYLEGWNGNGSFTCDRIGRGTVHTASVCISMLGGIQPGPLAHQIRGIKSGSDDGLIIRFQLLVYPDPPGEWKQGRRT